MKVDPLSTLFVNAARSGKALTSSSVEAIYLSREHLSVHAKAGPRWRSVTEVFFHLNASSVLFVSFRFSGVTSWNYTRFLCIIQRRC